MVQSALTSVQTPSLGIASLFSVEGKVALITGASSGLGSYAAEALALNGAKVYIAARREEKLQAVVQDFEKRAKSADAPAVSKKGSIHYIKGDLSNKEGVKAIIDAFASKERYLDILLHNAGINAFPASYPIVSEDKRAKAMWDVEWSEFSNIMDLNATAAYFVSVGFAPLLAASPRTNNTDPIVIINTSASAFMSSAEFALHYPVSKAAAEKIGKLLAANFKSLRVRVNTIALGPYPSEMTQNEAMDFLADGSPVWKVIGESLTPRAGSIEDFVGSILYLSSQAGSYLNANTILSDGGLTQTYSANSKMFG